MIKIGKYFINVNNISYIERIDYKEAYSLIIHFVGGEVLEIELLSMTEVADAFERLGIDNA